MITQLLAGAAGGSWDQFMGVDMASEGELIAARHTVEEIGQQLGGDSLGYLSLEGLREVVGPAATEERCLVCFRGDYPVAEPSQAGRAVLEPAQLGRCGANSAG